MRKIQELRKRWFEIIEVADEKDLTSRIYDLTMMTVIVISLVPVAFKSQTSLLIWIDIITALVFVADYVLRLATADLKLKKGAKSFFIYPFTPMAIIDLVSVLPSLTMINSAFRVLRVMRLLRALRVFRVFKAFRYSRSIKIIFDVFRKQREPLSAVCVFAVGYILVSALVVFNIEPETFPTFFDAVYWATVSLTTVGYGDIYAVSMTGKAITMLSSIFGIAIVALPAGIVTAGYMGELNKEIKSSEENKESEKSEKSKK